MNKFWGWEDKKIKKLSLVMRKSQKVIKKKLSVVMRTSQKVIIKNCLEL